MPFLKLWFYDPKGDKEGYLNHFVAKLDGPFCHCEVQFPDTAACTIYMGTKVVLKKRTFDPQVYTCVNVACSSTQLQKAREFAEREFRAGVGFSTLAMSVALLPLLSFPHNGTFCSKLCADVLKAGDMVEAELCTHKISPSALFRTVSAVSSAKQTPVKSTGVVTPIGFKC